MQRRRHQRQLRQVALQEPLVLQLALLVAALQSLMGLRVLLLLPTIVLLLLAMQPPLLPLHAHRLLLPLLAAEAQRAQRAQLQNRLLRLPPAPAPMPALARPRQLPRGRCS